MARKLAKSPTTSASRSSSKRPADETPARQSKRARATARKSYAEPETDDEDEGLPKTKRSTAADEDDVSEVSGLDDPSDDDDQSSESVQDDDASSEEDVKPKKGMPRSQATKKSLPMHSKNVDEKELWKPGAKLAPGTQLIIKKPKAREAGDTPYEDETIHPNTMLFLKDLAANNDRQWLKCKSNSCIWEWRCHWQCYRNHDLSVFVAQLESALSCTRLAKAFETSTKSMADRSIVHDPDFRQAFQDFTTFTEKVSEKIVEADELIPELPVKDVVSYAVE